MRCSASQNEQMIHDRFHRRRTVECRGRVTALGLHRWTKGLSVVSLLGKITSIVLGSACQQTETKRCSAFLR